MPSKPKILAFDTSAAHCAAAVLCGDEIRVNRLEPMARGQADRLMDLLEEVLIEAGLSWQDLDAIGVGVGPGNFTGIRISVAAARGLALGLNIPAVGVDGFDARAEAGILPAVPAPRDQVYIKTDAPRLTSLQEAEDIARGAGLMLRVEASPAGIAARIATQAHARYQDTPAAPAPLYIKPADAAPARDLPPALIDD